MTPVYISYRANDFLFVLSILIRLYIHVYILFIYILDPFFLNHTFLFLELVLSQSSHNWTKLNDCNFKACGFLGWFLVDSRDKEGCTPFTHVHIPWYLFLYFVGILGDYNP